MVNGIKTTHHLTARAAATIGLVGMVGAIGLVASGCASVTTSSTSTSTTSSATAGATSSSDPITLQRAQYVETMVSNLHSHGPIDEGGFVSAISGYGGGYVTDAQVSNVPGPTEQLTLTVVLGAGSVTQSMQGESDFGPSGIACFKFTVGYYPPAGNETQVGCPSSLTTASAQVTAVQQLSLETTAEHYTGTQTAVPLTLADAEKMSNLTAVSPPLTAADFATGTDAVQNKPDSALALPQASGGCIYLAYQWLKVSWVGGGSAGSRNSPNASAWAAATDAPCTGAAALAAAGFRTDDPDAGG